MATDLIPKPDTVPSEKTEKKSPGTFIHNRNGVLYKEDMLPEGVHMVNGKEINLTDIPRGKVKDVTKEGVAKRAENRKNMQLALTGDNID